jgi:hypothetical protein
MQRTFDELRTADLIVDAVYEGGKKGNAGDDPLDLLMSCGNQGGFRTMGGRMPNTRLVVIPYGVLRASFTVPEPTPIIGRRIETSNTDTASAECAPPLE